MSDSLYDLLRTRYHAYPLNLATARAVPGMLLNCRWRPTWPGAPEKPEFQKEEGLAWEFLKIPKAPFASVRVAANLIQQTVRGRVELGLGASLPAWGIEADLAHLRSREAILEVSGIEVRSFRQTMATYHLLESLRALERQKSSLWPWVNDDFLVTHAYYVTSLRLIFRTEGKNSIRGELEATGWKAKGGMSGAWKNDTTYEVSGRADVPAAVQGMRV